MLAHNVTLFVPQLIGETSTSWLERWPRYAQIQKSAKPTVNGFAHSLLQLFKFNEQATSLAAIGAYGAGLPAHEGWWLRADPVQFQADMQHVYLLGNKHISSSADLKTAIHELARLFMEDNIRFYTPKNNEWYLQLDKDPQIVTKNLDDVVSKEISEYLPTGEQRQFWQMRMTEAQMVLHATGKSHANGIWLWGEGQLPAVSNASAWSKVYTNYNIAKGLARLTQTTVSDVPKSFTECLQDFQADGCYVLAFDGALSSDELINAWLEPLWQSLNSRVINTATLYLSDGKIYQLSKSNWLRRLIRK